MHWGKILMCFLYKRLKVTSYYFKRIPLVCLNCCNIKECSQTFQLVVMEGEKEIKHGINVKVTTMDSVWGARPLETGGLRLGGMLGLGK